MAQMSKELASQIVVDYLKKQKATDKIEVAMVELEDSCWVVRGTCPIEFGERHWPERFTVAVDLKGKIKSADFGLL